MENTDNTNDNLKITENIRDNDSINVKETIEQIMNTGDQDITYKDVKGGQDVRGGQNVKGGQDVRGGGKLDIKLGDIVTLCAPDNPQLEQQTFFVEYISETHVKIINVQNLEEITIGFDEKKKLLEKTIIGWNLLSREDNNGYALLYGFIPKKWVNVYFQGDIPQIITGQITNIEEDMIEITPVKGDPFYIDFAYKGIPEELQISKIELREEPVVESQLKTKKDTDGEEVAEIDEANIEYLATGESIIELPESSLPDAPLTPEYDEIIEEEFMLYVEIPENEKIYGIEIQTTELLEKFLEIIPIFKRTPKILQNIHNLIERFKRLRKENYIFDSNGFVVSKKTKDYKPLIKSILSLDKKLAWVIPVMDMKKKIYYSDDAPIIDDLPSDVEPLKDNDNIMEQDATYKNSVNVKERNTLYDQYLTQNTEYQRPFITESGNAINTDYDVLVSNFPNENKPKTSVVKSIPPRGKQDGETRIKSYNFYVHKILDSMKYTSAISEQNGKKEYTFKTIPSDTININSIVIMPEIVIDYSRIFLPMTNILTRTQLSLTPFYLFNVLKKYTSIVVDDGPIDLLKQDIFHYKMGDVSDNGVSHLLEKIVPNNELLFTTTISKHLHNRLSLFETIRIAEPYLIYLENIDFSVYSTIKGLLTKKIEQYILQYNKNLVNYKKVSANKTSHIPQSTAIQNIIKSDDTDITAEFTELFKSIYLGKTSPLSSSSELLYAVNSKDSGKLFYTMITYILFFLITPDKLVNSSSTELQLDTMLDLNEGIKSDDCARKVIAKTYNTIKELEKDNKKDIYFDANLDETPYDIYKKYKNEKNKYSDKDFREYLRHSLIEIHHCPVNQVDEIVESMITGKKKVNIGEYAVLIETPHLIKGLKEDKLTEKDKKEINMERNMKKKYTYYKRNSDKEWKIDTTIQDENGSLLDRFCNSVKNCKKNPEINTCDPVNATKKMAENSLYASIGEKMNALREKIESIKKTSIMKEILLDSILNIKYQLGEDVKDMSNPIISPYIKIRQYILAESDFPRKQQYIIRFYSKFCREADVNEDKHWGYCRETNIKLFPRSLYELAVAFNNNKYSVTLDELIFQIGELSTDGDSVVDKYTGFVLKRIDDSTEEGYDESGFKIVSNAIIEKDAVDVIIKEMNKLKGKTFKNETAEKIYKVFNHIKLKTGLKDESEVIENFVMKQSVRFLCNPSKLPSECIFNENIFLSQKDFDKQEKLKATKKENYKKQSYMTYTNRNIIAITTAMYLVAIQTSIPGIKPRKTYPHCIYSYGGFPMTSNNELSGITFLSCIVKSTAQEGLLTRENKELWESIIKGYKVEDLIHNIVQILELIIVDPQTRDVYLNDLYSRKKEYLLVENTNVYRDFNEQTKKWSYFIPPLVSFSVIKSIHGEATGFKTELNQVIVNGNKKQHDMLNSYKSKIKQMTYGIVERIRNILKSSKNPLLLAQSFIQNACCNDNGINNPIIYFIEKDNEIRNYLVLINEYSHEYREKSYAKSSQIFFENHSIEKQMNQNKALLGFNKELIYGAYIHYCNYDNDLPIEDDLKDICNKKPDNYVSSMTLKEKIDLLEKNKIIYNDDLQIHRLMNTIHKRNIVTLPAKKKYSIIETFIHLLENEPLINTNLKDILQSIVTTSCTKNTQVVAVDDIDNDENEKMLKLIEFLSTENSRKYVNILKFFKNYGKNTKSSMEILEKIHKNKKFVKQGSYSFVKNSIKDMTSVYPNLIINKRDPALNVFKHWTFSQNHTNQLETNYQDFYSNLNTFFNDDPIMEAFLRFSEEKLSFYNRFIDALPIYSNIEVGGKSCYHLLNETSIDLLFKYIWYSVLEDYITISNDNQFTLKQRHEEIRLEKQNIVNMNDVSLSSGFIGENDLIEDVYDNIAPGLNRNDLLLFKSKVAELLKGFLMMQEEIIGNINYDYKEIKLQSFKISEKEKKDIIERIGKFNKYEQDVDKLHRKLKLGNAYVEPNFHKNPYFFEDNPVVPIEPSLEEGGDPLIIDYGDNNRDIDNPDNEAEDIGNPQYDEDDIFEDQYGEVRLEDD
jgi:hypothetical protein